MNWEFSPPQIEAIKHARDDMNQIFVGVGAIRSGKSFSCGAGFFIYTQSLNRGFLHIVAAQNAHVLETELLGSLQDLADKFGIKHEWKRVTRTWTAGDQKYILLAGHDVGAQRRIMGLTAHSATLMEATLIPATFWNGIMTRLTFADSKVWASCNPQGPRHWLKTEWLDKGRARSVTFRMEDNPTLSQAVIDRNKSLFDGAFRLRMIDAQWAANEGLICRSGRRRMVKGGSCVRTSASTTAYKLPLRPSSSTRLRTARRTPRGVGV